MADVETLFGGISGTGLQFYTVDNATKSLNAGSATTWTDINLSTYVPEGATIAVCLINFMFAVGGNKGTYFRKKGNTNAGAHIIGAGPSTTNMNEGSQIFVEVDSNRYIQYYNSDANMSTYLTVVGYFTDAS